MIDVDKLDAAIAAAPGEEIVMSKEQLRDHAREFRRLNGLLASAKAALTTAGVCAGIVAAAER